MTSGRWGEKYLFSSDIGPLLRNTSLSAVLRTFLSLNPLGGSLSLLSLLLFFLIQVSSINKSIGRLLCLPFENPGPAEAGPCQKRASSRFEAGTSVPLPTTLGSP